MVHRLTSRKGVHLFRYILCLIRTPIFLLFAHESLQTLSLSRHVVWYKSVTYLIPDSFKTFLVVIYSHAIQLATISCQCHPKKYFYGTSLTFWRGKSQGISLVNKEILSAEWNGRPKGAIWTLFMANGLFWTFFEVNISHEMKSTWLCKKKDCGL